jgi:hypothetical protein
MSSSFKATPFLLLPQILSVLVSGLLTYNLRPSRESIEVITVFPETPSGAGLNSFVFIALMAGSATAMYFLIRYGLKRVVRYLILVALFFVAFFLLDWFGRFYTAVIPTWLQLFPLWHLTIGIVSFGFILGVYRTRGPIHVFSMSIIGALTGTFLGASIPTLTAIVLLAALSVYDLLAVYKGPIGKIAESADLEEFTGAVFTYGDLTVGLGDMVFYSMLASNAMMNFGPFPFATTAIGVTAGAYLGFKMLEGREMFPGLPFALGLGLAMLAVGILLGPLLQPA